ncbi:MAG: VWA domain-containing protein [Anaerolineales bacterium]
MELQWPGFLLLLAGIPVLIAAYLWALRRRKKFAVRYSSLSLLRELMPRHSWMRRHLPFALFVLALASLIGALTRPVAKVTLPSGQTAVILAIDVSLSMCSTDIPPNRLEAAKDAAISFIDRQDPEIQIGIVAFAGFAVQVQEPTNDRELLYEAVESLVTARRTAIGSAILEAINALAEFDSAVTPFSYQDSERVRRPVPEGEYLQHTIVLLTDGVANAGPFPLEAAQQAVDRGIRVYTIGFGTANPNSPFGGPNCNDSIFSGGQFGGGQFGGGGGGFNRGIDEATLQEIAKMSGGTYYSATSANELQEVFQQLPVYMITREETTEVSVLFAALGAALVALALVFSWRWHPLP